MPMNVRFSACETTRHYAAIRLELKLTGQPIPAHDLWIAALSRQHAMPIVTRDAYFDAFAGLSRRTWQEPCHCPSPPNRRNHFTQRPPQPRQTEGDHSPQVVPSPASSVFTIPARLAR